MFDRLILRAANIGRGAPAVRTTLLTALRWHVAASLTQKGPVGLDADRRSDPYQVPLSRLGGGMSHDC